ncbi:PfkB family carbohydrate kinase [Nocardia sp. NPDC059240]|uniref:PfkB family carbohydrate kinase n=1 Tax=Nocardia sp. NPDC059240 TaxID=3346786 RepID=UPI00368C1D55
MGGEPRPVNIDALLGLVVVRRYAHLSGDDPETALLHTLRYVATKLVPAERLIVDAELNLGMLADLPDEIGAHLYGPDLGSRRDSLAQHWTDLHEVLGEPVTRQVRSERALRGRLEELAFTALAREMTLESVVPMSEVPSATPRPTVVVVGDAAWDRILLVDALPRDGESLYGMFSVHAGGKGLNRAVALARLGVDARLFAAVGDDDQGSEIVEYLRKRGVDTSLVRSRRGPTPTATVLVGVDGSNASIAGEDRIRFAPRDIADAPITCALLDADGVLLTFEQNEELLAAVSAAIADRPQRPWLFMSATPPKPFPVQLPEYLRTVDYLIASVGELERLRPGIEPATSARQLVRHGVGSVVVLDQQRCAMYSADQPEADPVCAYTQSDRPVAPGASSAFVSAFIARLITHPRPTEQSARRRAGIDCLAWAAAAIPARESGVKSIPDSMPTREAINRRLDAS